MQSAAPEAQVYSDACYDSTSYTEEQDHDLADTNKNFKKGCLCFGT